MHHHGVVAIDVTALIRSDLRIEKVSIDLINDHRNINIAGVIVITSRVRTVEYHLDWSVDRTNCFAERGHHF